MEQEVEQLVKQAEQVDREPSDRGDRLAEQLSGPKKLKRKLEWAKAVLEERARAKAAAQQAVYEAKVKARNKRRGRRKGCHIKPPSQEPQRTEQVNLTDEDSRLMRASKNSAYIQGYNAQAVVDAQGSQMVLGARVSTCASDRNELLGDLETIPKQVGEPTTILVDSGYENMEQIEQVQKAGGAQRAAASSDGQAHGEQASSQDFPKTPADGRAGIWDHQRGAWIRSFPPACTAQSRERMEVGVPQLQPQAAL